MRVDEQVVCGTHGRLKTWMGKRIMPTQHIKILVFDEADEMLKVPPCNPFYSSQQCCTVFVVVHFEVAQKHRAAAYTTPRTCVSRSTSSMHTHRNPCVTDFLHLSMTFLHFSMTFLHSL